MATPEQIAQLWTVLCGVYSYYGRETPKDAQRMALALYQKLLADIPGDVLATAAEQHMATGKFFPSIAELREQAGKLMQPALLTRTADEAWGDVLRAISGYYPDMPQRPGTELTDPIAKAVVRDLGGLSFLSLAGHEMSDRAQFLKAYEARQARAADDALLLPEARRLRQLARDDTSQALALPDETSIDVERAQQVRALFGAVRKVEAA